MPSNIDKIKNPVNIIGIDLGTTNSVVSIMENNKPRILDNEEGKRTTPSVVAFDSEGVLVGNPAKQKLLTDPKNTFFGTKRLIGRKFDDPAIQQYIKNLPFPTYAHKNGDVWVGGGKNKYSPAQIGGFILSKLKRASENYLGVKIDKSVITVPAYFNDSQRQATKDAGRIAGLDVVRVINEPTAAALAYGLDKGTNGMIAVFDLGGGTFDISILELKDGVFEVKSTNGDTHLGGEDVDIRIADAIVEKYQKNTGINLKNKKEAMIRIRHAAEHIKKELSSKKKAEVNIPYIYFNEKGAQHLKLKFTQEELNNLVKDIIERTIKPCKKALSDAGIDRSDLKHVILVGGMTRMPLVRKVVKDIFGVEPTVNVNPDEAIAKGAAIQAGVLSGDVSNVLLLDVASLSLGIETLGGIFSKIIPRNSTLPTKEKQTFTTSEDNQTEVDIKIYQGERPLVKYNKFLGELKLKNIPAAPRGVPRIEVTFESDINGIYKVTAVDAITKNKQSMELIPSGGLTEDEIERMVKEGKENEDEDRKKVMEIEKKISI
ncbi:Mitochondrial-type heat shock protein 70 [Astathelohania contejeani]|uniref:Mitochondrial-type heat shock protein 70 n=1 Tax=Astathelohania contejeani TaxID=164912 RepID=A0ABQ7HWA1_9MICR|nr:Mitochondrial-type heat shock protein 70 [Thelohania contejeani]